MQLLPPAEREIPLIGISFLLTFFFVPLVSKKKVAKEFRLFQDGRTQFAPTVDAPMVSKKKAAKEFRKFNALS